MSLVFWLILCLCKISSPNNSLISWKQFPLPFRCDIIAVSTLCKYFPDSTVLAGVLRDRKICYLKHFISSQIGIWPHSNLTDQDCEYHPKSVLWDSRVSIILFLNLNIMLRTASYKLPFNFCCFLELLRMLLAYFFILSTLYFICTSNAGGWFFNFNLVYFLLQSVFIFGRNWRSWNESKN